MWKLFGFGKKQGAAACNGNQRHQKRAAGCPSCDGGNVAAH